MLKQTRAGETAQWVTALAKSDNLSLIPGTHTEEEKGLTQTMLSSTHTLWKIWTPCVHTQ